VRRGALADSLRRRTRYSPRVAAEPEERRKAARNEALLREVNERIEEVARGHDQVEFLCECFADDCTEPVPLSVTEYEAVRRTSTRFVVLRGHTGTPDLERVVAEADGYLIVEKLREAAAVAAELDPRGREAERR
jgi:hypothetical protein